MINLSKFNLFLKRSFGINFKHIPNEKRRFLRFNNSYTNYDYHKKFIPPLSISFLSLGILVSKCDNKQCSKCKKQESECKCKTQINLTSPPKSKPQELTHDFLMKQSAILVGDSLTGLLTQTVSALQDYHKQYRGTILSLIGMMEEMRGSSPYNQELIHCKMIVLKSQIEDIKKYLTETELFLSNVESLVNHGAQTAYLAHAEYTCLALQERLQSASIHMNRVRSETKELEDELIELEAIIIVESGNSLK